MNIKEPLQFQEKATNLQVRVTPQSPQKKKQPSNKRSSNYQKKQSTKNGPVFRKHCIYKYTHHNFYRFFLCILCPKFHPNRNWHQKRLKIDTFKAAPTISGGGRPASGAASSNICTSSNGTHQRWVRRERQKSLDESVGCPKKNELLFVESVFLVYTYSLKAKFSLERHVEDISFFSDLESYTCFTNDTKCTWVSNVWLHAINTIAVRTHKG